MVNSSFYQIYEFSQGDTPETGPVPYGVRLNGGMTWEQVPPVLKEAKRYLEDQLHFREVRPDPCVFGQLLSGENAEVWYALVAVVHLDKDRFGRPLTVLRYFWCESEPEDWQCLQAILTWFAKIKEIPRWSLQDSLYLKPPTYYQVSKPVSTLSSPCTYRVYLLPMDYGNNIPPWQALQYLNRDVLATYWALKTKDPEGHYPAAWAWNVADLKDVHEFFIKPVDEVSYQKFKQRVPLLLIVEPDPAPPVEEIKEPENLAALPTVPQLPATRTSGLSIKDALQVIADNFLNKDLETGSHQNNLRQALQSLDLALGLGNSSPEKLQLQLPQDFQDLGCDRHLWEKARNNHVMFPRKFGLLFLWTLLLPMETIDGKSNIDHLLFLLTSTPQHKENQEKFKQFLRAIRKTFLQPLGNVDLSQIQNLTPITLSLLDLTCFFFGKLFVNDRQDSKSPETKKLQDLFKNLLQEPTCPQFLEIALNYFTQNLNTTEPSPDTSISQSEDWQHFNGKLRQHINRYHENWTQHQETYKRHLNQNPLHQDWYKQECFRQWPEEYQKNRESLFFWIPLFKNSRILTALESYQKKVLKQEEWWALRWQALFEHLDWGYSTVKDWPPDQRLPGGISFVPNPYTPGLRGKVEQGFQTVRQNVVTQWGNAPKPKESGEPPKPQPSTQPQNDHQGSGNKQSNKSSGGEQDKPQPQHDNDKTVWIVGAVLLVVIAFGINLWRVIPLLRQIHYEKKQFAESVITQINNSLGFPDQTYISSEDLASSLAETLKSNQSLIIDNNGLLAIGSKPRNLIRRLEDYQQRMGIVEQNNQFTETADSLLCLTIDRLIREQPSSIVSPNPSKPITPDTLDEKIQACSDERLFIDRQMYIAHQRFWFGEILTWTQQSAEEADIEDAQEELTEYLKSLNLESFDLDENIEFEPNDPAKQRQLLKAFYIFATMDQKNKPLDISEGLIRLATQDVTVGSLITTKGFFCGFSNVQGLNLSDCSASAGDPTASTPVPTTVATTQPQPGDIYAGVPDDVKSFVDRYSAKWNVTEEDVLDQVKLSLGINGEVPENVWRDKIRIWQRQRDLPADGLIGETTASYLEKSLSSYSDFLF